MKLLNSCERPPNRIIFSYFGILFHHSQVGGIILAESKVLTILYQLFIVWAGLDILLFWFMAGFCIYSECN
jgi:hypothetical protein